ncbi:ABC transporter permease [Sphingobacterium spiritivorum]|uniref:ABC transporter permease n=1 Tax=Sphingobacterium spiritivorum TaxID=258 RepID=UPI003DA2DB36
MLLNYIKTSLRFLARYKAYTFINIFGLAIGITGFLLIGLWIQHQISYNQFHARKDRIYIAQHKRDVNGEIKIGSATSEPLGPALQSDYPEVQSSSRIDNGYSLTFKLGERLLNQPVTFVDSSFFDIFSFEIISGSKTPFDKPDQVAVTQKTATKLFGDENPLGRTVLIQSKYPLTVTAVVKDPPSNSSVYFEVLADWNLRTSLGYNDQSTRPWTNSYVSTYVLLKEGTDLNKVNTKIQNISKEHDQSSSLEVVLYPFMKSYLYNSFKNGKNDGGRIDNLYIMGFIALTTLVLACINFMNLSTARSERRRKEIAIRKTMGATRKMLIGQFLIESILIVFFSTIIAIILTVILLPHYEKIIEEQFVIPYTAPLPWILIVVFIIVTGALAGSYPAFYLSSLQTQRALKGSATSSGFTPRSILVTIQFTCSVVLICSTLFIIKQVEFAGQRPLNFEKDPLLTIYLNESELEKAGLISNAILQSGAATSITRTGSPMSRTWSSSTAISWPERPENDKTSIYRFGVDKDFTKTTGTTIIQGRDIDINKYPADSTSAVLNESAVKTMNLKEPLGAVIDDNFKKWTVVGVIKDFVINSPYQPVEPIVIFGPASYLGILTVRMNDNNSTDSNIKSIEKIFKTFSPEYPLQYELVSEQYDSKFRTEQNLSKILSFFTVLSLIISFLGLIGLTAFEIERRKKEIGIRKILGASNRAITGILSKEFMLIAGISILISYPVTTYIMQRFLDKFAYRIPLSWLVFGIVAIGILTITALVVSLQTRQLLHQKLVNHLRDE